jgi:two-component system chemotaxis response regulator CheY
MTGTAEIKVLVVEDYEAMRMLIHRCLTRQGIANVRLKPSADEALAALRGERFDLIISDYQLGGADGLELLKSVRDNPATRDTRFIMLTGSDDRELVREAMALGADEYITKPFEPRSLRAVIERMFGADGEEAEDRGSRAFPSPRPVPAIGAGWLGA